MEEAELLLNRSGAGWFFVGDQRIMKGIGELKADVQTVAFSAALETEQELKMKNAYFAGGCFWCITPLFREMPGVTDVVSGYSGGDEADPVYQDVKAQKTGHREAIRITYDPEKTAYRELVLQYLASIDPYDAEGQFIDRGFSYSPAIFYADESELTVAEEELKKLGEKDGKAPAVALEPYKNFYDAEEHHQNWDLKNPEAFKKEIEESGRAGVIYLN